MGQSLSSSDPRFRLTKVGAVLLAALKWGLRFPPGRSQRVVLIFWCLLLAVFSIVLGDQIATTTNLDPMLCDQGAYLRLAEASRPHWWPTSTDGVRNPLFPWLLAKVAGDQPDALFSEGRLLNVRLGALLVCVMGWWAGRRLALLPAMLFVTIAFAVILPISTYAGAEVLCSGLKFAAWMQAFALFERLTFRRCVMFGATLGFAYLAKPSVTLLSACFVMVGLWIWSRRHRSNEPNGWDGFRPLTGALLALLVFGVITLPRGLDSWEKFGDPAQNTATRCFWADSWDECFPIAGHFNPRFIDRVSPEDRPSASRFFARHGWTGAASRFAQGFRIQIDNVIAPDRRNLWFKRQPSVERPVRRIFPYRGFFLVPPFCLAAALLFVMRRRAGVEPLDNAARWQAAFALLLVTASVTAFSWYAAVSPGARFLMALYLPVFASLLVAAEALRRRLASQFVDGIAAGTWLPMFGLITAHLVLIVTHPYFDRMKGAF
jgi:hypothetical protein